MMMRMGLCICSSFLCSRYNRIAVCLLPSPRACTNYNNAIQATNALVASVRLLPPCSCSSHLKASAPQSASCGYDRHGFGFFQSFANERFVRSRRNRLGWFCVRRGGQGRSRVKVFARFDPGGGNGGSGGVSRVIWNLALTGALTYLTITGKLGWLFDAFVSLWLLGILLPVVGVVAFLWFADREIMTGSQYLCPNCGNEFQVFKFTLKEESQLCPYCSQPFRSDGQQFVRDLPHFSTQANSFKEAFKGFGQWRSSSSEKSEPSGVIVDVEAEVLDKDEAGR